MIIDGVEYVRKSEVHQAECSDGDPPYGGVMFIETVTKYFVGEIVSVHPQEIVLRDACWVACTGRYHTFLADGGDSNAEFEPCKEGIAIIGRGSIIAAQPYEHGLIRVAK